MSRRYHLVVFDWEGTLGDTLGQILNTVAAEAKRLQFGVFDENQARQHVVLGLVMAVKKIFPSLTLDQHEQLLQAVHHSLVTHPLDVCLIPGAKQMIEQLYQAGIHLAIATNKGEQSLIRCLQACGLRDFFDVTRSAGQVPAKPCPQMLQEIMDSCGVKATQTLMVGDSVIDVDMANQLGVDAVGVDFDHQQAANLLAAGALHVFNDYQQLADYLGLTFNDEK